MPSEKRNSSLPPWLWIVIGIVIALVVAYLVLDALAGTHGI